MPNAQNTPAALVALPTDTTWKMLDSDVVGLDVAEAAAIRLQLESDRLSGDSGCNSFSGSYSFTGDALSIGPVASTKRGCPGPRAAVEAALFAALPTVTTALLEADQLILVTTAGQRLRFVPDEAGDESASR